jgi:hypothetical protein
MKNVLWLKIDIYWFNKKVHEYKNCSQKLFIGSIKISSVGKLFAERLFTGSIEKVRG